MQTMIGIIGGSGGAGPCSKPPAVAAEPAQGAWDGMMRHKFKAFTCPITLVSLAGAVGPGVSSNV